MTEDKYEAMPLSFRGKTTARYVRHAWTMPHAGPAIDINPWPLLWFRKKLNNHAEFSNENLKLRIEHFFVKAVADLLSHKKLRILNAYYWHDGEGEAEIRLYKHVNVGIAVSIPPENTKSGFSELVVPSVKKAETLSFMQVVAETERLIAEAVSGRPENEDLHGATCVVNNTGAPVRWSDEKVYPGSEASFSIMVPCTNLMLSMGAVRKVAGESFMNLALRFDHRVCNGNEPILFLRKLQELMENPEQILN